VSHTEATVRLRTLPDVTYRPVELVLPQDGSGVLDVTEIRRMRKKRVAVVMEGDGKRARDSMDFF
jgi:hypothetical protein